ncbi:MAG: DUF4157 domain-containing protein [Bacteroidia bacterium]
MATFATQTRSNSRDQHSFSSQNQKSGSQNPFLSNPFNKNPFSPNPEEASDKKQAQQYPDNGVAQLCSFFKGTGTPVVQTRLKIGQRKNKEEGDLVQKMPETEPEAETKNETGMPSSLRSGLESLSGEDLSGVRVHRNSSKPEAIDAHAYAQGQNIHLAPGQEKHLPHEGWHVVQQMQGRVQPTIQKKSTLINDDDKLEQEADVMGNKAVQLKSKDSSDNAKKPETSTNTKNSSNTGVVQRAMKFEYQFKNNYLKMDNGSEVHGLPRKFGPRDYIIHDSSGATLETETGGQIEFETTWEKKWSKLLAQITAIQNMAKKMDSQPIDEVGSDGNMYRKFPADWDIQHLRANAGFSMADTGRWTRQQKDGDAEVMNADTNKDYENFRSSMSYASDDNIIEKIPNGEKVFVHYKSSDGKWSRIEYNGTLGWIWSGSLTGMETKNFEAENKDAIGVKSDKPIKAGEKLLVEVTDSSWAPYTQISESFELEQYESYLQQYDPALGPGIITDTKQLLLNNNPETAPKGETLGDKAIREQAFLDENNKLRNLLLIISQYIQKGTKQEEDNGTGSAKYTFNLMSRTHFGSIFSSMNKKEQVLFTQMVKDLKKGIIPTMGLTTSTKMFKYGTGTGYNPTIYNWLLSITMGGDILSSRSEYASELPAAMGRFKLGEEKGKNKELVRFEARNDSTIPNFPVLDQLDDHALKHFTAAMTNRPRDTGKGGTGLEW